jgi:hypothetical protein
MWAKFSLPDSSSQSNARRIAELAGADYVGPQIIDADTLQYFRERVTGTSLAVWDRDLTVASLKSCILNALVRFGVAVPA